MTYPGNYSELSNSQKIIWLKTQRQGGIIGNFRNSLCAVYEQIRISCSKSEAQSCVYEDVFSSMKIPDVYNPFDFCLELHNLEYIKIQPTKSLHILSIIKEIDF